MSEHGRGRKILIVKVSSLGDVVHTTPVVADILAHAPDAEIDWLVEDGFIDLVRIVRGVRRAIPYSLRRWRKHLGSAQTWREIRRFRRELVAERYDTVIDFQGLIKTAWTASWARGPVTGLANRTDGAGFEWPVRFFYDTRVPIEPRTHVVDRSRQLAAEALGYARPAPLSADLDFGLDPSAAAAALAAYDLNLPLPYVVFAHATSRADKQWDEANWIRLGQALVRHGASLVLPWGSDGERATSERIAREFGAAALVPPRLSLPAVTGLLAGAAAVVGVDTGVIHIAAALKVPTVELYNFETSWRTGGYWSPQIVNLGGRASPTLDQVMQTLASFGLL
ncbi:lipopolysaccharide heptosyltransferase I [Pararobbsia silviterrae]|uniref:Lipopolysaccharide heptosyltransferase 1 n=1 Tax=Pararobbsia silviterrae TaxID=1792498 RepID=A0A494Y8T1_9BURK|nr:lipopolysaccharide heptosyltransferase I [Pararobbsia silviterrae]RKP59092.1 lipopolysaccharide heptosyltransferase I [Pararobbsia silviterrae]